MFWRGENEVVEEFVRLIRRVLKYQVKWDNVDYRVVSIEDNTPKVYEKFFEENEQYPVVTVAGSGFIRSSQSFNSFLGTLQTNIAELGSRGLALGVIDEDRSIAFALPSASILSTDLLYAMELYAVGTGLGTYSDTLDIVLYKDYNTVPVAVASASITNICDSCGYKKHYTEFSPVVLLNQQDYWLKFSTGVNNSYYIGVDTLVDNIYETNNAGDIARGVGSLHGSLVVPPVIRLGGAIEGTINVRCSAKNSTRIPRDVLAILANYIELFKQTQLTRGSGTDLTTLALENDIPVDEWLLKDIRIKGVRQAMSQERKRGDNDIIYMYDLTVEYYTEWHQDYDKDTLKAIDVELENFDVNIINEEDGLFTVDDNQFFTSADEPFITAAY